MPYEASRGESDACTAPGRGMSKPAHRRRGNSWAAIAPEHRESILIDAGQAGERTVAKRRLSELADVVAAEAVRQASDDWPEAVLWPMGFLVDRLRRRLAETHGADRRLSAPRRWPAKPTAAGPAGVLAGAANLGRTWGAAGVDAEDAESWIRVEFGDDAEAAAQAYTAACHGEELW